MAASALVTGGTAGLGAAVARALLDGGWRVVVALHDEGERGRLAPHERLVLEPADLFAPDSTARLAERAAGDPAAPLRAVVSLVGGFRSGGRVHQTPVEDFEEQLRLTLRPTYLVCAAAVPHLLAGGGGAVVCVSTRAALRPLPGAAGHVTSKAALLALVDALHEEYRRDGVRVNAVLPSVVDTAANRRALPDADHAAWPTPDEVAGVVRFLCSRESAVVGGARVPVHGRA
jgi:NAD(P)-dependent dehydrogenase (short-subunit alcohol dehydrogenase family)